MVDQQNNPAPNRKTDQSAAPAATPQGDTRPLDQLELETLASLVRRPVDEDAFSQESACAQAVERIKQLGHEPLTADLGPKPAEPSEAPVQLGHYRLLDKLGEGGMGAVYRAMHQRLEKIVAVKILPAHRVPDPEAVARFTREMKAVGRLNHPNIVGAFDAGEVDGAHFLVMEMVEGLDVGAVCRQLGPLPVAAACEIVRQAAVGLSHAHACGLVHRDIKPSNLMLAAPFSPESRGAGPEAVQAERSITVKILDLGLARLGEQQPGGRELTSTGQMMGTFEYMAPEQGSDSHTVDHRADIYSLGATLYKLLTGHAPFGGEKYDTPLRRIMALATEDATPIRELRGEVPKPLAKLLHRLLEKNPDRRVQSAAELAELLAPFADGRQLPDLLARALEATPGHTVAPPNSSTEPAASAAMEDTAPTAAASQLSPEQRDATAAIALGPAARRRTSSSSWFPPRGPWLLAGAGGFAAVVVLGLLLSLRTPNGTLIIESDDPTAQVAVRQNGQVVDVASAENGWKLSLRDGKYDVELNGDEQSLQLSDEQVTLTEGGRVVVRVRHTRSDEPKPVVRKRRSGVELPAVVRLTDLEPQVIARGHYGYMVNSVYPKELWPSMVPNVELAEEYLYAPAASRIRYQIPEGMRSFTAVAYCPLNWSVNYVVQADDAVLFDSRLHGTPTFREIRVDLPANAKEIDLRVLQAGGQRSMDLDERRFCWLAPRLHTVVAAEVADLFGEDEDHVKLTIAKPLSVKTLHSEILRSRVPEGLAPPIAYDGVGRCEEFTYACAPSRVEYTIPQGVKTVLAVGFCGSGYVRFDVYADNTCVFTSPRVAGAVPIDVLIPEGASTLALVVDPLGTDYRDYACWCYPRFYRPFPEQGSVEQRKAWISSAVKQLNPQFNGKIQFEVEDEKIVGLTFDPPGWNVAIVDLSPLRELKHLRKLDLQKASVQWLRPLARLPLEDVNLLGSSTAPALWPLVGTQLKIFQGPIPTRHDSLSLGQIDGLATINDRPTAEALREAEASIAKKAAEAQAAKLQDPKPAVTSKPAEPEEPLPPDTVRLIDIEPVISIVGWYSYAVKREGGPPLRRDPEPATEYLYVPSTSHVRYAVPEGMKSLSLVACRPRTFATRFRVTAGDKTLFADEADIMKYRMFTTIQVDLPPGTTEVGLHAEPSDRGGSACWLVPRLYPMQAKEIGDPYGDSDKHVSLTTLKPLPVAGKEPELLVNRVPKGIAPPVMDRGFSPCNEFAYAYAPSTVEYALPPGAKTFSAVGYSANGSVRFEVYADETRLYSSLNAGIVPINVKIPAGASTLKLAVVGENFRDNSRWCYPRLYCPFPEQGSVEEKKAWVVAELKRLNVGFDGTVRFEVEGSSVTAFDVTDAATLQAIGPLGRLKALRDIALIRTGVKDLSPLRGLQLRSVDLEGSPISDLTPLLEMPLETLTVRETKISGLQGLERLSLRHFNCQGIGIKDLSPLQDMELESLNCGHNPISDISILSKMPLKKLILVATQVDDLTTLGHLKLESLEIHDTRVTELAPLRGVPLVSITCDFQPKDAVALGAIKTLKTINGRPAAEVLKEAEEKLKQDAAE